MLRFKRPTEPDDFEEHVSEHRKTVSEAFATGGNQDPDFEPVWGDFKAVFSEAQFGRCGYCELPVTGGQHGDVEHYAPKSQVDSLRDPGREHTHSSRVTGRRLNSLATTGYWWQAYDWKNYLLSCMICNQKWKKTLFPVKSGDQRRSLPPKQAERESPLLMNPFSRRNPSKHLQFGIIGEVEPRNRSAYGRETIAVCGLDRPSLRQQRSPVVRETLLLLKDMADAPDDRAESYPVRYLLMRGHPESPTFPGMVRCLVEQELDLTWRQFEDYAQSKGYVMD